jgi:hypothetical protein
MNLEGTPDHRLVTYYAEPGTPDHDAMELLDLLAGAPASTGAAPDRTASALPPDEAASPSP